MQVLIPRAVLDVGNGGWGFLHYIWFLISGFMIVSSDRLQQHIMNQRWISLLPGVVLTTTYLHQLFSLSPVVLPVLITDWIYTFLSFFSAWSWLFAILGFGMKVLAFDRPLLRSAKKGVLPFFILHQTVLLCVGYFVMTWQIHGAIKWAIIFISSFLIIIMLCVIPYIFVYWYGIPGIIQRHLNCPRCPHLYEYGDCLQFLPVLTKWFIKKRKTHPFSISEKIIFYSIFILIPTYPIYWLLSNRVLLFAFLIAAAMWYLGQFIYFCKRCRLKDCPFNRVKIWV